MKNETKGVLSIMFAIFAFANPLSSLIILVATTLLQGVLSSVPGQKLLDYYIISNIISGIIFLGLAIYFGIMAIKEKREKLGTSGLIISALSAIYLIWLFWNFLSSKGLI